MFFKSTLYTVIPELEEIDAKLGLLSFPKFPLDYSNVYSRFETAKSNVILNGGDMESFYLGPDAFVYIRFLEEYVARSNTSNVEVTSLFEQKINLLEAAYSNLTSNNN